MLSYGQVGPSRPLCSYNLPLSRYQPCACVRDKAMSVWPGAHLSLCISGLCQIWRFMIGKQHQMSRDGELFLVQARSWPYVSWVFICSAHAWALQINTHEREWHCTCTVEPPNKGHFGNNIINSAVLSLIERLSSSRRFLVNRTIGNGSFWDPKQYPL